MGLTYKSFLSQLSYNLTHTSLVISESSGVFLISTYLFQSFLLFMVSISYNAVYWLYMLKCKINTQMALLHVSFFPTYILENFNITYFLLFYFSTCLHFVRSRHRMFTTSQQPCLCATFFFLHHFVLFMLYLNFYLNLYPSKIVL